VRVQVHSDVKYYHRTQNFFPQIAICICLHELVNTSYCSRFVTSKEQKLYIIMEMEEQGKLLHIILQQKP
jgi:hypothetical protein